MTYADDHACFQARSLKSFSAESRLSLLIDAIDNLSIYMLDAEGFVVTWNTGAQYTNGYAADEIIGRHFSVFFEPSARAAGKPAELLARAAREGRVDTEGWRLRKDGRRFWASIHIAAIRSPKGALLGFARVIRDATEEHQKKALERARDQAVRESQAGADLLAQTSHEMRTLLNAIIGYTDAMCVLFDSMSDAKRLEYLGIVNESSRGLMRLTNDILAARKTASTVQISSDPVDLTRLCERVANEFLFAGRLGDRALLHVEANDGVFGLCDEERLAQVLRNLLSNALKYGGPEVKVIVGLSKTDDRRVQIVVDDDGPGVPADEEEKIFGCYYRGRTSETSEGLGMGLAVCRDLLQQMEGAIGVTRSALGGARFFVTLPSAVAAPKAVSAVAAPSAARKRA